MLTVSWQPWTDASSTGYNLADLWDNAATIARWPEFLAQHSAERHPPLEAIRQAIIQGQIWAGGDWHQDSAHGMPVVSDGHFMSCTWREWGKLLAASWNSELGEQFTYLDFYMDGRLPPKPGNQ